MKLNRMRIKRSAIIALLCLMFPTALVAQEQQQVSLQFVAFPKLDNPEPIELITGEGVTTLVNLPSNNLSEVYKVPKLQNWVLGKSETGEDEKPSFKVYGRTNAAASNKQLVLVIRKGAKDEDGFDLVCFDGNTNGFSGGKYIFLNGSKVDVAGEIGDSKFVLKPQKHQLIAPKPSEEKNERKYLYVTLYFRKGEEAAPFYSSTWRFSDKARTLVVFYHEPHDQRLRTHTIRDYIQ